MVFSGNVIKAGNYTGKLAHYADEGVETMPGRVALSYVGEATITSTGATSWVIKDRNGEQPVLPAGAYVYRVAMKIPAGLTATNGNFLKVADAIGSGTTAPQVVASAAAASTTYAAQTVRNDTFAGTVALSGASTFQLFSTSSNYTTAGSNVSAAATPIKARVEINYLVPGPLAVEDTNDYRFEDATATVGYP